MKDYAAEELRIPAGKWEIGDENDAHCEINLGESGCRIDLSRHPVYYESGISRQEMRNVMHFISASKNLYNALREVEEDAMPTHASGESWVEMEIETLNKVKTLIALIREASAPTEHNFDALLVEKVSNGENLSAEELVKLIEEQDKQGDDLSPAFIAACDPSWIEEDND